MPDTIVNGVEARFSMGPTGGTLVDMTGRVNGTVAIGYSRSNSIQRIGSRGVQQAKSTKFERHDFTLTTESNAVHDPVLRTAAGSRVDCSFQLKGADTAVTFQGVVQAATKTWTLANDSVAWQISIAVDGLPE